MAAADRLPIGGVQWTTVIDFPDVVAATLFTIGCNSVSYTHLTLPTN